MATVAIVGGTGVLGRALIPLLLERGDQVRLLARSAERAHALFPDAPAGRLTIIEGDLLDTAVEALLPDVLRGSNAAAHLATAIPSQGARTATDAWERNTRLRTEGTRRLIDAALAAGVRRYLQQSIIMRYQDGGDRWIDEHWPLEGGPLEAEDPVRIMERTVRAVPPERMAWCILRGGLFVGPGTSQDDLVERIRAGREAIPGSGRNFISLIHVADMAAACAAALDHAPAGSTFNIVDEPLRAADYVRAIARRLGAPAPPLDAGRPEPPSRRCSNAAARTALGWTPVRGVLPP